MRDRMIGGGFMALALVALIGCGSSGASSAPASSTPESAAPASDAASAAAPSEAAASEAAPSGAAASEGTVPSFTLPSDDKALEALIPDKLCGVKVTKLSIKGDKALNDSNNTEMKAVLQSLGKSPSDVSVAMGINTTTGDCSALIFRIAGVDEGRLRDLFKAEAIKEGNTYTEVSLGGKNVAKLDNAKFEYAWVKGDGVIIVVADNEADAATIISQLP